MRFAVGIILSLIVPGLGQFVNGQRIKGSIFLLLDILFVAVKNGLSVAPLFVLYLVAIVDVIIYGVKIHRGELTTPSGRSWVIEIVLVTIVASLLSTGVDSLTKGFFANSLFLGGGDTVGTDEKQKVKKEAESYLNNKYGKNFTVNKIEYTWQTGEYTMRGHAENETSDFLVQKDGNGKFSDSYFFHVMSREAEAELKPQVEGNFPNVLNWKVTVWVEDQVEQDMAGDPPSIEELRNKTEDYKEKIRINVVKNVDSSSVKEEAERLSTFFDYLNQNKIKASVEVNYYDPSIKSKGIKKVDFQKQLRYDRYLTATLEINDVSAFQSVQEIAESIEVYN